MPEPGVGLSSQSTSSTCRRTKRFFGMFSLEPRWSLSLAGWVTLTLFALLASCFVFVNIYPFLAVTERISADTLVVEGWIHEYAARSAADEFEHGGYQQIFTTGGPVVGKGGYINDYNTSASVGADLLKKTGIPRESIQMVPSRVSGRDRTYSSAVALRNWFAQHDMHVSSINVMTEQAHARRTRLLFEEALGPHVNIGIIAISSPDYDAKHWWRYSDGVREVIGEGIAYLYAKLFFQPDALPNTASD